MHAAGGQKQRRHDHRREGEQKSGLATDLLPGGRRLQRDGGKYPLADFPREERILGEGEHRRSLVA